MFVYVCVCSHVCVCSCVCVFAHVCVCVFARVCARTRPGSTHSVLLLELGWEAGKEVSETDPPTGTGGTPLSVCSL